MPELPEVETYVTDLRPYVTGRRIVSDTLSHADILAGVSKRRFLDALTGARITAVDRRAKHAVVHLQSGLRLVVQPWMTEILCRSGKKVFSH